jgi:DNA-binding HxlR family transcriptional regulator
MSIRLQTWFPYSLQIALNGREWLRRSLDKEGCRYLIDGNKFLHIDDYALAQRLLDRQLDTRWGEMLVGMLSEVFPSRVQTLGDRLAYYWTLWQSEWATDYIFESPTVVTALMDRLLRHALMTGTGDRVLRYLGRPVKADGQPHPLAHPALQTRIDKWSDGARIRHWVDRNSVKLYNEHNVLRAEMTMNNPSAYQVHRLAEGQQEGAKRRLPLRKGVADIVVRTQVAADVNHRFMAQMATLTDQTPLRDLLQEITQAFTRDGRRVRALDITGKDRALLQAIADPEYAVSGMTNKALQPVLGALPWAHEKTGKPLVTRISRHLRLLRDHGVIRKLPRQRKYQLTETGRKLTTALAVLLAASTEQLLDKAA